jgi:hypothetical protein
VKRTTARPKKERSLFISGRGAATPWPLLHRRRCGLAQIDFVASSSDPDDRACDNEAWSSCRKRMASQPGAACSGGGGAGHSPEHPSWCEALTLRRGHQEAQRVPSGAHVERVPASLCTIHVEEFYLVLNYVLCRVSDVCRACVDRARGTIECMAYSGHRSGSAEPLGSGPGVARVCEVSYLVLI